MGGCRCSYLSCKSVSDNRTHFFHYPVRDKERCLKWMMHAGTTDFHKLDKTQVKNKVICEYHFLEKCFMNSHHDRLVHDAIPTENGPYNTQIVKNADKVKEKQLARVESDSEYDSETTDLGMSDVTSTTLAVAESPVLGLAFYSKDKNVKKPRDAQAYTEVLTRKNTGMVEILKRKLLETSQQTAKPKVTSSTTQRCNKRNVAKIESPIKAVKEGNDEKSSTALNVNTINYVLDKAIELSSRNNNRTCQNATLDNNISNTKIQTQSHYTRSHDATQVENNITNTKTQMQNNYTSTPHVVAQIENNISNTPTQSNYICIPHDTTQIDNNTSGTKIQPQSCNDVLPEVIVVPVESEAKLMTNSLVNMNEVRHTMATPSTIILINDGDIMTTLQNKNPIRSSQKITVLESKTLPALMASGNLDNDGSSTISNNVMRMIERNSREIIELKNLVAQKKSVEDLKRRKMCITARRRRVLSRRDHYVRKLELFSNIVQYLSPKVTRLVYKDMFK